MAHTVANGRAGWTPALAVHAHAGSPDWPMVERPQLLARFFRPSVFCLYHLAGAVQTRETYRPTLMVGSAAFGVWAVRARSRSDGRGAFPFPSVIADRAGRLDRALPRLEFLPRTVVSLGVSVADDPHSLGRLQPDHISSAVARVE